MSVPDNVYLGRVISVGRDHYAVKIGGKVVSYEIAYDSTALTKKPSIEDIVFINDKNELQVLWQSQIDNNAIIATNACNQRCSFCPQPLGGEIMERSVLNSELLKMLKRKEVKSCVITGGEPTLLEENLIIMLKTLVAKNRKACITLLTNGMKFDNVDFARDLVKAGSTDTRICIPLHSDAASIHDSITNVSGAFERTTTGILNLERSGADIEIRVVLSKLNVERLPAIALSIAMNFPFVSHVAFMGMELHASAADRAKEVWIDPPEYMHDLDLALYYLRCRDIPASIYNLPFCLVPPSLWPYLQDSISKWKKVFTHSCEGCSKKSQCPGLFGTSAFQSPHLHAI